MRLLVGYDGSDTARRALAHAAALVGPGGTIEVINVIPAQGVSSRLETIGPAEKRRQRKLLREAEAILREHEVAIEPVRAFGDPTTEIRAAASGNGAGIVVVGRGSGLRRLINGSVSARLLRNSPCDVLVVR